MISELFLQLTNITLNITSNLGYIGILILMIVESSFIPFPSEVILIPAGALIAQGKMSFMLVLAAATAGSILGALINYFIALHFGRKAVNKIVDRFGNIFFLDHKKLAHTDRFFNKHGELTTLLGRLIPGIRQLISIPAGFSNMNLGKFILFTGIGAAIWSWILIFLGFSLGENLDLINQNLKLITWVIILFAIILITIYIIARLFIERNQIKLSKIDSS